MVLAEFGQQIAASLKKLYNAPTVDENTVNEVLKEVAAALLTADVDVHFVSDVRRNVRSAYLSLSSESAASTVAGRKRLLQRLIVQELSGLVTSSKQPYKPKRGKCNVIMFVGLQGSGKTTTVAKLAHLYRRKNWKVGLVCADTFRAGAFDQLKQNAAKVGVPFYGSYTESDPVKIGSAGVARFKEEKFEIILVDTSGRHSQEEALFQEMRQMAAAIEPDDVILIVDSHIGQACFSQASAFAAAVDVGSVIVTKLDGHAKGGGALSAVAATGAPITHLGVGETFDELEPFDGQGFIQRLLGMGDIKGLLSTLSEAPNLEQNPEIFARMFQGQFTFRDVRSQMENILSMGSLSTVMSMIPGLSAMMPKGEEKNASKQVKDVLVMLDSMTKKELDVAKPQFSEKRVVALARGSGKSVEKVRMMLDGFRTLGREVGKIAKMGGGMFKGAGGAGGNPMAAMAKSLMANPGAMQKAMKQLGGGGGMAEMLKNFDPAALGGDPGALMGGMDPSALLGGAGGADFDPSKMAAMMKGMAAARGGRRRR